MSEDEYNDQQYREAAYWAAREKEYWAEREKEYTEALNEDYYAMVAKALNELLSLACIGIGAEYDKSTNSILVTAGMNVTHVLVTPNTHAMIHRVLTQVSGWYSSLDREC